MDKLILLLFLFVAFPTVMLALPMVKRSFWKDFPKASVISFLGIVMPAVFFVLSAFLVPDAKNRAGVWGIGCFYLGKLALTPLALWGMAAFYAVEVARVEDRQAPWIVLGYCAGAIVSDVCTIAGIACAGRSTVWTFDSDNNWFVWLCLIVPICVSLWYSFRALWLAQQAGLESKRYLKTLGNSLPLWVASVWWSKTIYDSLPQTYSPGCFVVTAATRGHRRLVGPFFEISRRGENRTANRQLLTFWQFEEAWGRHSPKSHALFRRIYNRIGPVVARRITRAWLADLIYLALKPVEITAQFLVRLECIFFKNQNAREASAVGSATTQTETAS